MSNNSQVPWPELPIAAWRDTAATVQLWTQIVGKIRLAKSPWLNHSWHVVLYVTPRGLTTSPVPDGTRTFEIDFDLVDHRLRIVTSDGMQRHFALPGHSVASFHAATLAALAELGIAVTIDEMPNELSDPVRFSEDTAHASYDPEAVRRFLQILGNTDRIFKQFRTGFIGKSSPVHFFWGSFDLAVTRFSGRTAPLHPGGVPHLPDAVAHEAYSHEVSSAGFWPGGGATTTPRSIPMPIPSRRVFVQRRCVRIRRSSAKHSANSFCPTMPCERLPIPTRRCSISCKALMRLRRSLRSGIARHSNAIPADRAWCGRFNAVQGGLAEGLTHPRVRAIGGSRFADPPCDSPS